MMELKTFGSSLAFLNLHGAEPHFQGSPDYTRQVSQEPLPEAPGKSNQLDESQLCRLGEKGDQHRDCAPKLDVGPIFANKGYAVTWRLSKN
jgi:hypothetical protein